MARKRLDNELSIVRRVRLFREHFALMNALKKVIDTNKLRREARYMILNHDMPLKQISSDSEAADEKSQKPQSSSSSSESESSYSDSQEQKPIEMTKPVNTMQTDENFFEEHEVDIINAMTQRELVP